MTIPAIPCDLMVPGGQLSTTTWVLVALAAVSLLLFLYPYLLYPKTLQILSRREFRPAPAKLTVSLLFCAYNEIESLPAKLQNLGELKRIYPALEILVYDDASSDGTYQLLARNQDVLTVVAGSGRMGKAAGMKQLAAQASGNILIFTDANIILSSDAIERALPYYGDDEVGGLCCTIRPEVAAGSATSIVGSTFVALDDRLQQLESATGNVMGATGGLFSIRRELYPSFPDTVQDDFLVSMSVIFQGRRLVKATDVIGYEKVVARSDEEFRRKVRIGARAYHTHACMRQQVRRLSARDRFKYFSRKVLRWYGGMFLILAGVFTLAAAATISTTMLVVSAAASVIGALLMQVAQGGPLASLREILLALLATLTGVVSGMRGHTYATWTPAKSR